MYASGASDGAYLDWRYLNGATVPPATGLTDATVTFRMPVAAGSYEVRLFASNSYTRLATSGTVTVVASPSRLTVNGVDAPTAASVAAGAMLTLDVSGGPANTTDWVGLYAVGAADGAYLTWRYLSGTTSPPASGLAVATLTFDAPTSPGSYEFRFFAANTYARLTASTTIVIDASAAQLAVNHVAPSTGVSVAAGSVAVVSVSGGPANPRDWVALYPTGAPNGSYLDWRYLSNTTLAPSPGVAAATLTFTMPIASGTYEFRFFADNGYGELTTSAVVTVVPSPAQLAVNGVSPPSTVSVQAGSRLSVQINGGPANPTDWIGLYAVGAADGAYLTWRYLSGTTSPPNAGMASATLAVDAPTSPGSYEFRFFAANTYAELTTSATVIVDASSAQLAVNTVAPPTGVTVVAGSVAVVTVSEGPGNAGDWVGLYFAGAPNSEYLAWRYLSNTTAQPVTPVLAATLTFPMPVAAGSYEFRFFADNGYGELTRSATVTILPSPAQISVNGVLAPSTLSVLPGSALTIHVTGGPGNATDWLALAATGAPDTSYVTWMYLNGSTGPPSLGLTSATVTLAAPLTTGSYELRLYANNGYARLTTSATVTTTPSCTYVVTPTTVTSAAGGGTGTLTVATNGPSCTWTATSDSSWATLRAGSGTGSGTVDYTIAANVAPARSATLTVAGQSVRVSQDSGCSFTVSSPTLTNGAIAPDLGGGVGIGLSRRSNLPNVENFTYMGWWQIPNPAITDASFFFLGNLENPDPQPYISASLDYAGGTRHLLLELWNGETYDYLTGNDLVGTGWIHVAYVKAGNTHTFYFSDPTHDATADISVSLDMLTLAPTSLFTFVDVIDGTATAATGVKVWEAALTPAEIRAEREAGYAAVRTANLYLNTPLAIASDLSDSSGNGHGWAVDAFEPGNLVTVSGPFAYVHADYPGATGAFYVTASADSCAWTAASDVSWTSLDVASGAGPGAVTYAIAANPASTSRTATVTIANQSFSVAQDAAGSCDYTIFPSAVAAVAAGQTGWVAVDAAGPNCTGWVPGTDVSWITLGAPIVDPWAGYTQRVLADGPVAYWTFDDAIGGGTTIQDLTGHGLTATLTGGAAVTDRGTLSLDGATGRATVGASSRFGLTHAFTIELWLGTTSEQGRMVGAINDAWSLHVVAGGYVELRMLGQTLRSVTAIADGEQHMVNATWTGSVAALYIDGAFDVQTPLSGTLPSSAGGVMMGADPLSSDSYAGLLDDVVVFDVALGAGQIADRYVWDNGEQSATSGVFAYTVAANPIGTPRVAAIGVADQSIVVTQSAAPPAIATISPTSGGVGTPVTIAGTGFGVEQGTATLWLGTKPGTVVTWSDTQIVAAVSTGALSGTVQVRRDGTASNAVSFTVLTPTVTSVTVGGDGTQVTITGSNFGSSQGAGQVWLGTVAGTVTSWSNTQIVATVAAGSTVGQVQILQGGVWGTAVPFTPASVNPHINAITPNHGAAGTAVTIYGAGFGASQGAGVVSVGGTSASVNSWRDSVVSATVATSAVTGVVKIQQNGMWSNAKTFTVPSGTSQLTLSPNVISLLVGDTRTIQSLNAQGAPVAGLAWTSGDPSLVTLSSSDPPMITAIAPGNVIITAGSASADVTVYAVSMPTGTVLWSDPGSASGVSGTYIAVPNYDAVADVFATQNDGRVQAITSDGTVAWTASVPPSPAPWDSNYFIPNVFIPDFQGGLVVFSGDAHSISSLDGLTGQVKSTFTATSNESIAIGLGTPAVHTDGTIFTIDYACKDDCSGDYDGTEGAWVVGIDPASGASKFRVPTVNSTETRTVSDVAFCAPGGTGTDRWEFHSWPSTFRIAGDGFAYLSYTTTDVNKSVRRAATQHYPDAAYDAWDHLLRDLGSSLQSANVGAAIDDAHALFAALGWDPDTNGIVSALQRGDWDMAVQRTYLIGQAGFRRPCDVTTSTVTKLHLMRVNADGVSSDVVVKTWRGIATEAFVPNQFYPFYQFRDTYTGPASVDVGNEDVAVITNADRGALYSWAATQNCQEWRSYYYEHNGPRHDLSQTDSSCVTGAETHLTAMTGGAIASDVVWNQGGLGGLPIHPVLQLEDDSFVGNAGNVLLVFDAFGNVKWTLSGYYPAMATAGGGLIARAGSDNYAFDADGTSTGPVGAVPTYSFSKQPYASTTENITVIATTANSWATGFASMLGGNPTGNGTAVGVAEGFDGPPAYAGVSFGTSCPGIPQPGAPVDLGPSDQATYLQRKSRLFAPQHTLTSDSCTAYANQNPAFGAFFDGMTDAVNRQIAFDGSGTTISQYAAGMYSQTASQGDKNIKRQAPVCQLFTRENTRAASQGVPSPNGDPARAVYLNTNPRALSQFTPADLLHEALHNLTALNDDNLAGRFDLRIINGVTDVISAKLVSKGCAPR